MAGSLIAYDRELPEIPGRLPWAKPTSFLVKDDSAPTGWREDDSGRRPSKLLLVPKIRSRVDAWRDEGYPGASEVSRRLFNYWFDEDHDVRNFPSPFRYYFCQREAIETLVWLVEVYGKPDAQDLIRDHAEVFKKDLFEDNLIFQTTMDGRRQVRRFVSELQREGVQDLPPDALRRYAFKMATGSGKTWAMAMAIVWSHFHKQFVTESELVENFLIVAPNVIVFQRLERDFGSNSVFRTLPLVPPEWPPFEPRVILRGESTEPAAGSNLFLTNIHQLYESREQDFTPQNAIEALLGKKPAKDLAAGQPSMLERIKTLPNLVVLNDEAHHVHDEDLAWSQSLLSIHNALPRGLSLWLDFSATPKDQNGMYFPWTVCDYPLAQAVEDRIVKAPIIVTNEDDPNLPANDPDSITKENVAEKYGYWLRAAVTRWKEHRNVFKKLGVKPVLFIMAEKNDHADKIGEFLWSTKEFGFKKSEVLVIHTNRSGEVKESDLDLAREAARNIDTNDYKVIVSVMMLREGWDVRNVSVVLGLRPFTAKAEILPEQVIGRGLRLMLGIGADRTQTLEVLGTSNLLKVLKEQLEIEGVGAVVARRDPILPVNVYPLLDRQAFDIAIPLTKPSLVYETKRLSDLDVMSLAPIYEQETISEAYRIRLTMEFATTETEVHQEDLLLDRATPASELLASITNNLGKTAGIPSKFAELYPVVRSYVQTRAFGRPIDIEDAMVRSHLARLEIQEGITKYLAREIGKLATVYRDLVFENAEFKLSDTKPFSWRRNLPPLEAQKTVFNYVATFNDFERQFAIFLDRADNDVVRFAALGTTQQGESNTQFRVDYLKPSGAIGFYYPDWVVVQHTSVGEVNWIIETKGRVWESTAAKDRAMKNWCERVSHATGKDWRYVRLNQVDFEKRGAATNLAQLLEPAQQALRSAD